MTWDVPAAIKSGLDLIEKFVPDTDAKNRAKEQWNLKVLEIAAAEAQQQSETNKVEAQNSSLFVSGWRPACGWAGALAFAWMGIGQPVFSFAYTLATKQPAPVIALPSEMLMSLLFAMLGIGGYRTIEKIRGVAK
jgi:hypothetical protein